MAAGPESVASFMERFQNLQKLSGEYEKLIQDLLLRLGRNEGIQVENEKLLIDVQVSKLDLEEATESRRDLQQRLQKCNAELDWYRQELEAKKNRNSYVLVAIDGDGLIFRQQWIRLGLKGGRQAAKALRAMVSEQCGPSADKVEIVVKIVADLGGLARALVREGSLESPSHLRDFAAGFSQVYATCNMVDVGPGAASSKVKETTKWHLEHDNCKHVLLGVSHDGAYAPFLTEILQDETVRPCITVIEGHPAAQELVDTQVKVMCVGSRLFRSDKLSVRTASNDGGTPNASPTPSIASSGAPAAPTSMSWANVTSSGSPPLHLTLPLAPKAMSVPSRCRVQYQQFPPQQPDWSPGPRGLDEPIIVSVQALDNIKKRKDSDKLCNNHFLRGPCTKGHGCHFAHSYKPTPDEINAIAVLARQNPCTSGQYCEADDCIYGHHCPSIKDGVCIHPYCRFPDSAHPPGTKFKKLNVR
ncbi:hypothetical protein CDD82_641 [Ophiocordyceps australis]|uniref:C3H1-type domain-containing protein n=1 Tax=Ophiocordyceps australis TaxID=1399860 RepID=A0A2C5ZPZ7_9HYPO|nr:hypothetical protein CDD82_641 [Ophiocordyceps australis]